MELCMQRELKEIKDKKLNKRIIMLKRFQFAIRLDKQKYITEIPNKDTNFKSFNWILLILCYFNFKFIYVIPLVWT